MKKILCFVLFATVLSSCGKNAASPGDPAPFQGTMDVNFNGKSYHFTKAWVIYQSSTGQAGIFGGDAGSSSVGAVTIAYTGTLGSFNFGDYSQGKVDVTAGGFDNNSTNYYTQYSTCNPTTLQYAAGTLAVSKWGNVGERIEGTFTGSLVDRSVQCAPRVLAISGSFSAVRAQ